MQVEMWDHNCKKRIKIEKCEMDIVLDPEKWEKTGPYPGGCIRIFKNGDFSDHQEFRLVFPKGSKIYTCESENEYLPYEMMINIETPRTGVPIDHLPDLPKEGELISDIHYR